MEVQGTKVVDWVKTNLPPLSWQILTMQNMKVFLKHKISPSKIEDHTRFNAEIIACLSVSIKDKYNKELPNQF